MNSLVLRQFNGVSESRDPTSRQHVLASIRTPEILSANLLKGKQVEPGHGLDLLMSGLRK